MGVDGVLTTIFSADGVVLLINILIASFSTKEVKSISKYPLDEENDEEVGDGSEFFSTRISTVPYKIDVLIESKPPAASVPGCSSTVYIESLMVVSK